MATQATIQKLNEFKQSVIDFAGRTLNTYRNSYGVVDVEYSALGGTHLDIEFEHGYLLIMLLSQSNETVRVSVSSCKKSTMDIDDLRELAGLLNGMVLYPQTNTSHECVRQMWCTVKHCFLLQKRA